MALQKQADAVYVDPELMEYAVRLVGATRRPADYGLGDLAHYITFGASPRASINLILGARALALTRGRDYVVPPDIAELAPDVLRHRLVLSYEALADRVTADEIINRILESVPQPVRPLTDGPNCAGRHGACRHQHDDARAQPTAISAARPRPRGQTNAEALLKRLEWQVVRRLDGILQGDYRSLFTGHGFDLAEVREYQAEDDIRYMDWNVTARMDAPYVRQYIEDREITAWLVLDLSPSIDFGTTNERKRDLVVDFTGVMARLLTRHGNRVGAMMIRRRPRRGASATRRPAPDAAAAARADQDATAEAIQGEVDLATGARPRQRQPQAALAGLRRL